MPKLKPIHPGELLLEEFLVPMQLSQYRLAKEISVPPQRISEIVAGARSITADTDLRLCRFFGLSNGYWLRAQVAYDTEVAARALAPVLRRIRPWARLALLAISVSATTASAQPAVSTIALKPGAEFPEPFSSVSSLHELPDGRVLLVDQVEKRILRLDFATGRVTDAARQGQGPLEFSAPGQLIESPAGKPLYQDFRQARLLRFDSTGRPSGTLPLGSGLEAMMSLGSVFGADARGRLYSIAPPMRLPDLQSGAPMPRTISLMDSQTVVRFVPGSAAHDTVLRLGSVMAGTKTEMTTSPTAVTMRTIVPDGRAQDVFRLLPDGRFAVLRGDTYRLRFVDARGRETLGPVVPTMVRPVTPAMQRAAVDSLRAGMLRAKTESDKQRAELLARMPAGVDIPVPRTEFVIEPPARWAPTLSPWVSLSHDGTGRFWVGVPRDLLGTLAYYDLLSPTGALLARVTLPPGERLVALSGRWVYTVRSDADDLQYLTRYPMPALH